MKSIQVTDEMHAFLTKLKNNLLTQDNRATADPIMYGVTELHKTASYNPDRCEIYDCHSVQALEVVEVIAGLYDEENDDLLKDIAEVKKLSVEDLLEATNGMFSKRDCDEVVAVLNNATPHRYQVVEFEIERYLDVNSPKLFLTEEACSKFIAGQKHNLNDPKDYVFYMGPNSELKQLLTFIKELE